MKALIFDLDGTLLYTLEDLRDCTNYALRKFGFPERSLEEIRNFLGNGLKMLVAQALPEGSSDGLIAAVLAVVKDYYMQHYHDKTVPYEGILPMLATLKQEGYPMAIVSNKADPLVQLLRELYFRDLIPVAVGERETTARKPAPDMVHLALEALGTRDACYIGDSEVDVQTAGNSGLPCLAVSWGFRSADVLRSAGAETICATPEELLAAIRRL